MSRHLMARMRRTSASEFPWSRDDRDWVYGDHGVYHPGTEAWHAPLENGHRLRVWDDSITEPRWGALDADGFLMGDLPPEEPGSHWRAGWDEGVDFPLDPEEYAAARVRASPFGRALIHPSDNGKPHWEPVYEDHSPLRAKAYPSREQAMAAVERRYRQKHPIGGPGTGSHDSGVDYDSFMRDYDPRKEY